MIFIISSPSRTSTPVTLEPYIITELAIDRNGTERDLGLEPTRLTTQILETVAVDFRPGPLRRMNRPGTDI